MIKLNTRESLYPPIEIEIDGKIYRSVKLSHVALMEFGKIEDKIKDSKTAISATVEWVQKMFSVNRDVLDKLEYREIEDIYIYASKEFVKIEKERMEKEITSFNAQLSEMDEVIKVEEKIPSTKNRKRPGEKES